jgi:hypothetical protein
MILLDIPKISPSNLDGQVFSLNDPVADTNMHRAALAGNTSGSTRDGLFTSNDVFRLLFTKTRGSVTLVLSLAGRLFLTASPSLARTTSTPR